jgi:hypothetical protein
MGYRSDVGFACDPAVAEVIGAVLELNPKDKNDDLHTLVEHGRCGAGGKLERLYFESVKWYENYEDVGMFNKLISFLETHDMCDLYGFIRIGEDYDDIETQGTPYEFDMGICRSIDI